MEKYCGICKRMLSIDNFTIDSSKKDGHSSNCRDCRSLIKRKWKMENKHAVSVQRKRWLCENPGYMSKYKENNPEKFKEAKKRHYQSHKKEHIKYSKEWRRNHPEKVRMYRVKYEESHKDELDEKYKVYARKYRTKPHVRLRYRVSSAITRAIHSKKAGRPWESLVGYTLNDLVSHLEDLFLPGMTWENIGKWHIDHIIPVSAFNITSPEDIDFKKCWSLNNLRPLWASDNILKSNKLSGPHQPSLGIC